MLNYLEISETALRYNARTVCEYVGCPVIGVVKCNGYGVGIAEAARIWIEKGASMLAVSKPEEAMTLRASGFSENILLLAPVGDRKTLIELLEADIILTITGEDNAQFYSENRNGMTVRVHTAVDTGMGRFGVRWTDIQQLLRIYSSYNFIFEGIFSHFSASFEKNYKLTKTQLERFLSVTDTLKKAGYDIGIRHIANSCAALRFPETRLDAVRSGGALVGKLCAPVPVELKRVGTFISQVVDVKLLKKGDTTGYASVCKVKRDTKAVVVAIGHDCGFGYTKTDDSRSLRAIMGNLYHMIRDHKKSLYVMYGDKQLKLIGRIGSQYSLFDASSIDIKPGEYVTAVPNMLFPHKRKIIEYYTTL